ncbi:MAG TPA: AMP-binding protein [Tepidisphaeraceae bacterium]|nr:AMP-binding protein [Tepidisphaeraceae bacterium]
MQMELKSPADGRFYLPAEETLDSAALAALQRKKLAALLEQVRAGNAFYQQKLNGVSFDPRHDPLDRLPLTTREELEADQSAHPPYGRNLTFPLDQYTRLHQTSGTGGRPMRWLDTRQSWEWFARCWGIILTSSGVTASDRVLFAFSFGPFVGFWGAFEGACALGTLCLPAGGMSTVARLRMLLENQATVVCCTPTYALRMAEVAVEEGIDLPGSSVRLLIVAGEPGGSIPETRRRIETAWGARLIDHTGMTEMGAVGFECLPRPGQGVHVIESEYIPEVIDPNTLQVLPDGATGELVLTNLGRWGSPLIRYRTGDQVRLARGRCECGRCFARLEGGILGRVDDMFVVRGNNVFPAAVEAVLRRFSELNEFRLTVHEDGPLTQVLLEIEPMPDVEAHAQLCDRVGQALHQSLSFRAQVVAVPAGSLPRFELKAHRFIRKKSMG